MSAKLFLDTNVLLYLLSTDQGKADRAEALLAQGSTISVQVLNECTRVMTGKLKMPLDDVRGFLSGVRHFCDVEPLSVETHDDALDIMGRYGFSIYDSLIIAAAARAGCERLYSEDMQHGQRLGDLTVLNPFV